MREVERRLTAHQIRLNIAIEVNGLTVMCIDITNTCFDNARGFLGIRSGSSMTSVPGHPTLHRSGSFDRFQKFHDVQPHLPSISRTDSCVLSWFWMILHLAAFASFTCACRHLFGYYQLRFWTPGTQPPADPFFCANFGALASIT
jgi:hypothetical protein